MSLIHQFIAAKALAKVAGTLFPGCLLVQDYIDEAGFSYEIAFPQRLDNHAIPLIEESLRELIKQEIPLNILEMMRENAIRLLEYHHQPIKADQVAEELYNIVRIVKIEEFYDTLTLDLPPTENLHTGVAGSIKMLSLEIKYQETEQWDNYFLATFTGVAAENKQDLKKQVKIQELARRNHPGLLGSEMNLFHIDFDLDPKGIFWSPRGTLLKELLHEHFKTGSLFQDVISPPIPSCDKYQLMSRFFSLRPYSLTEFPIRYAETFTKEGPFLWNHEFPVPYFQTTRLGQILCLKQQVVQELISSLQFIYKTYIILGFRCQWILLTSKGKTSKDWRLGIEQLKQALSSCEYPFEEQETLQVLPGPRIELQIQDVLNRNWTMAIVEFHLALTRKLAAYYQELENKIDPVLICETVFTSLEKAIALLLQSNEGILPFRLLPEHVRILPIGKGQLPYAAAIEYELKRANFRVEIDSKDDSLGNKIHRAEKERIPYQVIVGEQEAKNNLVSIRLLGQKPTVKNKMALEEFIQDHLKYLNTSS